MSFEQDETSEISDDTEVGGGADGLKNALSAGDMEFGVSEEKPAGNRSNLVLVGVVLIGAAIAYFMFFKQSPTSAEATPADAEKQDARQAITEFLGGGSKNIAQMEQLLKDTEQVVDRFSAYPSATQIPLDDLKTNPFRVDAEKPAGTATESALAAQKRREEERKLATETVSKLQLQSVISGTRAACMINNAMYTVGQQIEGCLIEEINSDSVIVRCGSFRFALKMQQ